MEITDMTDIMETRQKRPYNRRVTPRYGDLYDER